MKNSSFLALSMGVLCLTAGCGSAAPKPFGMPQTASTATAQSAPWNPLEKQEREADTLFLLDADEEAKWKPGEGGLMAGNVNAGFKLSDKVAVVDGKFRRGYKSITGDYGYAWTPATGLISPDEWTVEYWVKSDVPADTLNGKMPLAILNEHSAVWLQYEFAYHKLTMDFRHNQAPTPVSQRLEYSLQAHPWAANEWHNIATTFKNGTLRFYVDGALSDEAKGIPAPRIWSDAGRGDGLCIGGAIGRGSNGLTVSDLRISRRARVLGERAANIATPNTLTVSGQETGVAIEQHLLGGLHYYTDDKTAKMGQGILRVMRTDKMLTATPIKAGAPDAAHPAAGASGKYAYDWTVVDRTFDYYKKLGVMPYISIDSTPEILGGKTPPFNADYLKNPEARSGWSGFTPEVPNDMAAFGALVGDLVHHVVKERGDRVPYWGVWNEPDGPGFFSAKLEDYLKVYDACARAVKGVDASLQVGGPETGEYKADWNEGLIKYCAANKLPLDFISWHYYLGELTEFSHANTQNAVWAKQYGLPKVPALINGEWTWQGNNLDGTGYAPFSQQHYHTNDFHAAFVGASLIEMQQAGVKLSIFTNPVAPVEATGWDSSGLVAPTYPWANMNVFRMWNRMAPQVVATTYDGVPGVWQIASRDKTGRLTILLSHWSYRKDSSPVVTVKLPAMGNKRFKVTQYLVDDAHSNARDAGVAHAELETVPAPPVVNGQMNVSLRPRAVTLLVVEPQK